METLFAWHRRPGAFQRMTPPWESVEILQEEGSMESGGTVLLGLQKGPARLQWKVGYTAYEPNRLFQDEQISGPFGAWRHAHRFHPMGPDRSILEDEVEWEPPMGSLGSVFATGFLQGTLERLMVTPAGRADLLVGYMLGFLVFAAVQSVILMLFTVFALNVDYQGALWQVFVVLMVLTVVGVSLGIFVSTFADNEFQVVQFIPILLAPQIFLSGVVLPVSQMPGYF